MKSGSRLVESYVGRSVLPYIGLALLLLTAVLLAQQINRFSELLGATRAPISLALEVLSALLPGILVFTLPMAMLAGSVIGLSRMGSDSEIVALRAAGIGTSKILTPLLLIGTIFSAVTLYLGLEAAPLAAQNLRRVAFRAALSRLESPVEPRTFNTEIPGKVIYVRDGNEEDGRWGRIFISSPQENGARLLITARSGRIDSTILTASDGHEVSDPEEEEQAELVLSDAAVTTLPSTQHDTNSAQVITERLSEMRVRLDAPNRLLLQQMRSRDREPEELRWNELIARAQNAREALTRTTAATTLHKKLAFGTSPFVFALLAVGLGVRVRRGGRGIGVLLSIFVMICYYLLSLGGEQAARGGVLAPFVGAWLATGVTVVFSIGLLFNENLNILARRIARLPRMQLVGADEQMLNKDSRSRHNVQFAVQALSGLMDRGLMWALGWNFCGAWIALVSIFLLFTLFELGRFLAATGASAMLIVRYLFYLVPMVGVALAPVSLLVAVLATYAIMARRREAVAWWACGQSVYRLALPAVACAVGVSIGMWFAQERIMPEANRRQDALRTQIRGGVAAPASVLQGHQQWLAGENRIFSYEFDNQAAQLRRISVYEFDAAGVHLERITNGQRASVSEEGHLSLMGCEVYELNNQNESDHRPHVVMVSHAGRGLEAFKPLLIKPNHLKTDELSSYISLLKGRGDVRLLAQYVVALERRRADLLAPLVMALIGLPMALAFGRRSAVTALCTAIVVGLLFWAVIGGAQQMAIYGQLPPVVAAWFPPVIFLAIGIYMIARTRT